MPPIFSKRVYSWYYVLKSVQLCTILHSNQQRLLDVNIQLGLISERFNFCRIWLWQRSADVLDRQIDKKLSVYFGRQGQSPTQVRQQVER